jgi:signal transduction histidine kinase
MRNLRTQLIASHLAIVALMTIVMALAVGTFFQLGRSISRILRDNYASVIAAEDMKESLERIDSAATFYLAGQTVKARQQYQANLPVFEKWMTVEENNITEVGEQQMANDLAAWFPVYRLAVEKLLNGQVHGAAGERIYYFRLLEPSFLRIKQRAQDVLDVNQAAMWRADHRTRGEALRAAWAALDITAVAFVVALLLARRSIHRMLVPLRTFATEAAAIGAGDLDRRIDLKRDDEIGTLAAAYNQMAEDLREARRSEEQRLKTEFISVAAHELRTPVTSLQLSVELLLEGAAGKLTDDQQTIVAAQQQDLARLQKLMQDLLDTGRLEAGALPRRLESIAVGDIVRGALDSVRADMDARNIDIKLDMDSKAYASVDRAQMTRVFVNLLANAVRHSPVGGLIEVDVCPEPSGKIEINVRDQGAGIPRDYLPRIFDRFVQVPGATRGGAGLGLSIAQSIVKAHGGSISVDSTLGKGSTFTVRL